MAIGAIVPFAGTPVLRSSSGNREAVWSVHIMHCIERCCSRPCRLRMTLRTIVTKIERGVICRRSRSIEIRLVTLVTIDIGKIVIPVDMTRCTWFSRMRSLKREVGVGMIKRRRFPCRSRMAGQAVMRKLIRGMVWIDRRCIIALMALIAIGIYNLIISASMAVEAGPGLMRACQCELCI